MSRGLDQDSWANKDYLAAHIATTDSQDPATIGQAFEETWREAGQKTRNPRLFSLNPDKRGTSPDLGSGRSISYEAEFTLAMIQMDASRKTAGWSISAG